VAIDHSSSWAAELTHRVRKGFIRTTISTSALTSLFFVAYFWLQRHPTYMPMVMPRTQLDMMIPFQPAAILAYLSVWVYIGVGPGLQRTIPEFAVYGLWLSGLCVTGLVIFYFWPTQIPTLTLAATDFPGFGMLRRVDESSNACPSMHVAVAIFTAVRVDQLLRTLRAPRRLRLFNAAWFTLIVYSTLAIKQHVALDVVAGAVLGLVFARMSLRWRPGLIHEARFATLPLPS
jgi:membrane-associated phospholipid phosphatase